MRASADDPLLGGLAPAEFLCRHWQKQPLLVRQAVPGFHGCVSRRGLFALASRDDVESRIVVREQGRWSSQHGPFAASHLRALPARGWTLLVHGVNLHSQAADALLRRFSFIPYARLDDVMVSYAAPGGGVGAHVDSYDVFLLQGEGRRRWRFGAQRDLSLRPGLPLKILKHFRPSAESTLGPGDMLYLPPDRAHEGVAIDACMTCSIGFRAPGAQELGTAFLDWMRDSIALTGRYADPQLAATDEPARIGSAMLAQCSALLGGIRWDDGIVARFLGCHLTEPKPQVFFSARNVPSARFANAATRRGLRLDPRTQILYDRHNLYVNGMAVALPRAATRLKRLANERRIAGAHVRGATFLSLMHGWYEHGYIDFE